MYASKKADVIRWLQAQPLESDLKRSYFLGWAVTVGVRLNKHDYRKVTDSGIDRP